MHGRDKRSSSYRALAFLVLGGAHFAIAPFSALASNQVNVNVNPTTGYYEYGQRTMRVPAEMRIGNAPVAPSVVRMPNGMTQSLPGSVEIVGQRASGLIGPPPQTLTGSVTSTVRAGAGAIKNGATRCLTSFRCNVAAMLASASLGSLLDSIGGLIDDSGKLNIPDPEFSPPSIDAPIPSAVTGWQVKVLGGTSHIFYAPAPACHYLLSINLPNYQAVDPRPINANMYQCYYINSRGNTVAGGTTSFVGGSLDCPAGYSNESNVCKFVGTVPTVVASPAQVESSLENWDYQPDDWPWITAGIDRAHPEFDIIAVDLPSITGVNDPNFIERSDGSSQGTYSEYEFDISGVPGKQPSVRVNSKDTTTEYDAAGNPQGTTTSTSQSSSFAESPPDIPTDCEFMPTVCRFIDWFTEPDPQPDPDQEIRDLVQVYEDGGRDVVVGSDSGSCPPPRTIELSLVPSVQFSFQPFCDLATAVRFWLLALASFGAAYMTVRSI